MHPNTEFYQHTHTIRDCDSTVLCCCTWRVSSVFSGGKRPLLIDREQQHTERGSEPAHQLWRRYHSCSQCCQSRIERSILYVRTQQQHKALTAPLPLPLQLLSTATAAAAQREEDIHDVGICSPRQPPRSCRAQAHRRENKPPPPPPPPRWM